MKKYILPFLICIEIFFLRAFTIHNSYDLLPSARAFVSDWLNHDWYLSQIVPYRLLFNIIVGHLYSITESFWITFFGIKILLFSLYGLVFSRLLPKFGLQLFGILVFIFIFSSNQSMIAMEWIYGDVDTKSFAYLLFFFALNDLLEKRYFRSCFFMGLSASFHVLVGGYLSILFFAILVFSEKQLTWKNVLIYVVGATMAFYSMAHQLLSSADSAADLVYVLMRVPHHVLPNWKLLSWLPEYLLYNFLFIIVLIRTKNRSLKILCKFLLLSNIFWFAGFFIYFSGKIALLKIYFFRVTDTLFPFGSILLLALLIQNHVHKFSKAIIGLMFSFMIFQFSSKCNDFRHSLKENEELYQWIKSSTPEKATFLVDPTWTDFYMKAERAMVVSYKHSPQRNELFNDYLERLNFASSTDLNRNKPLDKKLLEEGYKNRNPNQKKEFYTKYNVDYVLAQNPVNCSFCQLVYRNKNYYVYKLSM